MTHLNVNARPGPSIDPGTIARAAVAFLLALAAPAVSLLPALTTGLRGTGAAVSFPHGYAATVATTLAVTAAAGAAGALIARRAALAAIPLALVWWALAGLGVTLAGLALGHPGLAGWGIVLLAAAVAGAAAGLPLAARPGPRGPDAAAPLGPTVANPDLYPCPPRRNAMRTAALAIAAITAVVVVAEAVSIASASPTAGPSTAKSTTLTFDVVFSPFSPVAANNAVTRTLPSRWATRSSLTTSSSCGASTWATMCSPA